ncbi:MAG: tetrahydrofolate dehydrogenase/cyclohydrolase catalytic domain-containing protein [Planctomycetota bacterium]
MSPQLLAVTDLAASVRREAIREIEAIRGRKHPVAVAAVLVGDCPLTTRLLADRGRACQEAEVDFVTHAFPVNANPAEVEARLADLSNDPQTTGLLLALAPEAGPGEARLTRAMAPQKDLAGEHPAWLADLLAPDGQHRNPRLAAVLATLETHEIDLYDRAITVVGHATRLGWPLGAMLSHRHAAAITVVPPADTLPAGALVTADVLILHGVAPGVIGPDRVREGATVLDLSPSGPAGGDEPAPSALHPDAAARAGRLLPAGGLAPLEEALFLRNVATAAREAEAAFLRLGARTSTPGRGDSPPERGRGPEGRDPRK